MKTKVSMKPAMEMHSRLLRNALNAQGMRPGDLAKLLGVSPQYINNILGARNTIPLERFNEMNSLLGNCIDKEVYLHSILSAYETHFNEVLG